jgi:hypothetical protein
MSDKEKVAAPEAVKSAEPTVQETPKAETPIQEAVAPVAEIVTLEEAPKKLDLSTGSKVVFLRAEARNGHLPKEVLAEAVRKLSSVFSGRQPLRGLDQEEEKKYLGTMLDVGPEDKEWGRTTRLFWAELRIPVPFKGVPLEIGLDQNGFPLDLDAYVKYRFAKAHPHVGNSEADMKKYIKKVFYIQDLSQEAKNKNNSVQVSKLAYAEFIKACEQPKKLKVLITTLGNMSASGMDKETMENILHEICLKEPARFLKLSKDKDLELRAEIHDFLETSVLHKVGNAILDIDDIIGNDIDEAIVYLRNPRYSSQLNTLRVKHREATS